MKFRGTEKNMYVKSRLSYNEKNYSLKKQLKIKIDNIYIDLLSTPINFIK